MPSPPSRTFVLGLDGIPWNLLARWADTGQLPNVSRLMSEGATGPLRSTMPPTTPIAWPTIATGTRADKHGIYGFRDLTSDYGRTINTSTSIREPPVWEILSPSFVVNVPMTYPAEAIDGTMVTGMMTPDRGSEGYTHPPEFATELETTVPDYEIGLAWHEYHDREEAFLDDLEEMVSARRSLMHHLMQRETWELFFFVYTAPDRLQHLMWDTDIILEHYQTLDDILGEVMAYTEEQAANLFVVSDHGFGPVSESIHLNTLLEQEGYLRRKPDRGTRRVLGSLGIRKESVTRLLDRTGGKDWLLSVLPDRLLDDVASKIPGEHGMFDVDFESTQAFTYSSQLVYVNDTLRFDDGVVSPAARDGIKTELKAVFENFEHPETGETFLEAYDGSELFPTDPRAPDLIVESQPGSEVLSKLAESVITPTTSRAANHRRTGIFLAKGPNIANRKVRDADVVDVLPTLLQSRLRAIPREADGNILDIFESESPPATNDPTWEAYRRGGATDSTEENFSDVKERLRGLGYME